MSVRKRVLGFFDLARNKRDKAHRRASKRRLLRFECMEARRLLTTIDLAALSASEGMTLYGSVSGDLAGDAVSNAGDVNGDGYDDMIIGANSSDIGGFQSGSSFVVFGGPSLPASINLSNSLGAAGFVIVGTSVDRSGKSVSGAGDVNGDGFDDLVIGSPTMSDDPIHGGSGAGYIVFGGASISGVIQLSSLGSSGVSIFGADTPNDQTGYSVSGAGDLNGDGHADIVVGAYRGDTVGDAKPEAGESFVIFGGAAMPSVIDLEVPGAADITILGSDSADFSGFAVSEAGDVNGDGFDDLLIGAWGSDGQGNTVTSAGESYLIFGSASLPSTIDIAVPGSVSVTIFGAVLGDAAGHSLSSAGDVNGDGLDDILINAPGANGATNLKNNAGNSYVIFGSTTLPTEINLATLGSAGITIFGAQTGDSAMDVNSGGSAGGGGDINGDGFDDLIIGFEAADAAGNAKSIAGETIIVFGGPSLPATIDLATPANADITIYGAGAGDRSGKAVSIAGDVNGDGFADFLIGAPLADGIGNATASSGESYLIFGGNNFTNSILPANLGTSGNNTITGTAVADILNGADGNDTLVGNGGVDVLLGGRGDDILAVSSLPINRLLGGTGKDTLRLDSSGLLLNLTTLADNRLLGIEQIDITGSGINTLTLSYREVLNISDESNQLIVRRNGGDIVNIGSGWTQGADQLIGADNFQTYTQGIATLLIEDTTPVGTTDDDAFVFTYLSTSTSGNVSITRSTNAGPIEDLGVFPMNVPLSLDGLSGTDSIRIVGTSSADTFSVTSAGLSINGASLTLVSMESRTLEGGVGNDAYQFDADAALGAYSLHDAGAGIDTIDLSTTSQNVALNLNLTTPQVVNANLSLTLVTATVFENVTGGSGNDILRGNARNNAIVGGSGNDTLIGGRGNDSLLGELGDDNYVFTVAPSAEADSVTELPSEGIDQLTFSSITTAVTVSLASTAVQNIHVNRTLQLNSGNSFENITGGSGNDVLTGNDLNNILMGGSGNDVLNGANGNDSSFGGLGNDTFVFGPTASSEADLVTEYANQGTDLLNFGNLTTSVNLFLGSIAVQAIHANRTLKLNSTITFENATGGSGDDILQGNTGNNVLQGGNGNDVLVGNSGNDQLFGGSGRDILIGGLGLDVLDAGSDDDILIGGRTNSDASITRLTDLRTEWTSANSYATRIVNLRAGVGASNAALAATIDVLNDAGEDDLLTGGADSDWYFAALDDVLTDLAIGEVVDRLNAPVTLLQTSQTGAQIATNPAIKFFETGTINGSSLDFNTGAAGTDKFLFEWDLLAAGTRGELEIAVTIDYTALTIDNDFIFGLTDGVNLNAWERSDNNSGSWWKRERAVSGTSVSGFTFVKGALGAVEPFTIRFRIPTGVAPTQVAVTEGSDSITTGFAENPLNGNNALKFFMARQGANEDYRINSVHISVTEYN